MGALKDYRDQNRAYYGDADELSVAQDLYQRTGWAQSGRSFDDFVAAQGYGEDLAASRAQAAPGGLPSGAGAAQTAQGYGLPEADGGVRTSDFVRSLGVGLDQTGQLLGRGMQWAGLTDTGKAVEDLYAQRAAQTQAEQSPAYRAEMSKPWLGDEAQAPGVLSPTKVVGSVIESAPSTAMGMGVGVGAVKMLAGAGMRAGLAGVAGGALGEGGMAGAQAAMQTEDMMRAAPEEMLRATPQYQTALAATPQDLPEADRHALARRDVEVEAMLDSAMATAGLTALFGAPSGHFLGRTIGGETGKTLGGTMLRQAGLEALQEAPQSASEQVVQNVAERRFSNPDKDILEGVADAAVGGAVTGAAMGGGLGGLAHNPGALRARREFEAAARGTIQEGGLAALSDADLGAAYVHADTLFQQEPEEGMRGILLEINAEQNRRQRMAGEPEPSATPDTPPQPGVLSADSQNAPGALPTGEIPLVPESGPETPETPETSPALAGVTETVDAAGDPVTVLDLDRAGQGVAAPEAGPDLSARVAELSAMGKADLNALAGELGIEKPGRIKRADLAAQVAERERQTAPEPGAQFADSQNSPATPQETPPQPGAQFADSQNAPVPGREEPVTRPQAAQPQEPLAGPLSGPETGVVDGPLSGPEAFGEVDLLAAPEAAGRPVQEAPPAQIMPEAQEPLAGPLSGPETGVAAAQPQAPAMPETGPDLSARTAELSAMPKEELNTLAAQLGIWKPGKIKRADLAAQVAQWEAQRQELGVNQDGRTLFADAQGFRYYLDEQGVRRNAPMEFDAQGTGMVRRPVAPQSMVRSSPEFLTAEELAAFGAQAPQAAPAGPSPLGVNRRGQEVFEDENGVRYVVENGVRIQAPVEMRPTRSGVQAVPQGPETLYAEGGHDFLTGEEWERFEAQRPQAEASAPATPQPQAPAAPVYRHGLRLVETTHTKTGEPIFVAKIGARVDRDVYEALKSQAARHGGRWSRFSKGFLFKTKARAEAFMAGQAEAPAPAAPQPQAQTAPEQPGQAKPVDTPQAQEPRPSVPDQPETQGGYTGPDRRRPENADVRKRVADMTPEERARALLTSEKTGLANERAYLEDLEHVHGGRAVHALFDADNFKAINDTYGHEFGDVVLGAIGEAIAKVTRNGYHIHGDEFIILGPNAAAEAEAVRELLARAVVRGGEQGETYEINGIGISFGVGPTKDTADVALRADKEDRARRGLRSPRGGREPGRAADVPGGPGPAAQQGQVDEPGDHRTGEVGGGSQQPPLAEHFRLQFAAGKSYASIVEARKEAAEILGRPVAPGTADAKIVDEAVETGVVLAARQIVRDARRLGASDVEVFRSLTDLYQRQPNLSVRTSTSVAQQAYSTPAPLAFLASRLAGVAPGDVVYEPTAGNGMLLVEVAPESAVVNELNPDRAANLEAQGFTVSQADAASHDPGAADVVLANPPFGRIKESGETATWTVGGLTTPELDHAIIAKALETLGPDGRAVVLLGGKQGDGQYRARKYHAHLYRQFYGELMDNYRIRDHFTIDGDLYKRQGAGYPVDVIVIEGRGKTTGRRYPGATPPRVYESFEALEELFHGTDPVRHVDVLESGDRGRGASGQRPVRTASDQGPGAPAVDSGPQPVLEGAPGGKSGAGDGVSGGAVGIGGADGPVPGPRQPGTGNDGGLGTPVRNAGGAGTAGDAASGGHDVSPGAAPRPAGPGRIPGMRPGGLGQRGDERPAPVVREETAHQITYQPASAGKPMGTLVPKNMSAPLDAALERVRERRGGIESFVAERLGYAIDELHAHFAAEQIDALALAVNELEDGNGFVLGDQTGIGKGRVVAAVIRYAQRRDLIPVFVTMKPDLYADMVRDLADIGSPGARPLATNAGLSGDKAIPLPGGGVLRTPDKAAHEAVMQGVLDARDLGDYDAVFTTYDQLNSVKGQDTFRRQFLSGIADRALFILDESHNAGGGVEGARLKKDAAPPRSIFMRALLATSPQGVLYSSATYAKRPDSMSLYFKTDMRHAVEDIKSLSDAISKGGVPMQQAVASMLTETGQYIRRERSFKGATVETVVAPANLQLADGAANAMSAILEFDTIKQAVLSDMVVEAAGAGEDVGDSAATGDAGASSTNFTSIMHNLVGQTLLAIKAEGAVADAVASARRGSKPVITVANTMGSFIAEYAEANGLAPGDPINLSFADLFTRYLEKTREVVKRDRRGVVTDRRRLTDEELGPEGVAAFDRAAAMIRETDFADLPVSPIDWILQGLRAAGLEADEITGRTAIIDYAGPVPVYRQRRTSPAKNIAVVGRFNSAKGADGGLDALILNQSGSTGISLHASENFTDRSRRDMIIAQPELNIDVFMQMLGRVFRTGQVVPPGYRFLVSDVPAEKRPAAVLGKKLASLNANTTASRTTDTSLEDIPDFLNEYGDAVAAQIMADNPDLHERLGKPLRDGKEGNLEVADAMRRLTGRIPLLPVAEQKTLYEQIEGEYKDLMAQVEALGGNTLEAKTLDFGARLRSTMPLTPAREEAGSDSPFAGESNLGRYSVKLLGKPFPAATVREMIEAGRAGPHPTAMAAEMRQQARVFADAQEAKLRDQAKEGDAAAVEEKVVQARTRIRSQGDMIATYLERFPAGQPVTLLTSEGLLHGVVVRAERKGRAVSPVALGAWKMTVAVADAARQVTLSFSKLTWNPTLVSSSMVFIGRSEQGLDEVLAKFDAGQSESREDRWLATGNLLAAYDKLGRGQVVNFTDDAGTIRAGILLPRGVDIKKLLDNSDVSLSPADKVFEFIAATKGEGLVKTADGVLSMQRVKTGYRFQAPAARSKGGVYYLNRDVLEAAGQDFVKSGNLMQVTVDEARAGAVVDALRSQGVGFVAASHKDEARGVMGLETPPDLGGGVRFQRAWHGTHARDIERFDTAFVGAGEGRQSFGWGMYFASRRDVAEHYRDTVSAAKRRESTVTDELRQALRAEDFLGYDSFNQALDALRQDADWAERYDVPGDAAARIADMLARFEKETGQVYETEVPEDHELLDWDRPLSEQPEGVREKIAADPAFQEDKYPSIERSSSGKTWRVRGPGGWEPAGAPRFKSLEKAEAWLEKNAERFAFRPTGELFYRRLTTRLGSDKAASEYLASLGVPGLRYLDGWSRGAAEGTHNYVIFEGDKAQVVRAMYRREASPQSKAAADALTAEVARLAAELPGLAGLVDVHAGEATLPAALRREVDAAGLSGRFQGAYYDGRIFVVAANIPDARAGRLALAEGILRHEGRHAGLTRVFGSDRAKQDFFMDAADAIDADVRAWLASNGMAVTPETRAEAAEEIVVEWAVDGVSHGLVDRLLARIMAFLRRVFPGLRPTRPEVREMMRRAVAAADAWMGGVPDKPGFLGPVGEMSPAFSRYQRDDAQSRQTDTQAFRAWFGDSKVVDENGEPLMVYHGTRSDFSTFKNPDGFRGFYFTRDPAYAEMKTSLANGRIMPVYLSIQRPLVLDGPRSDPKTKSSMALRDADIERLQREGYDGIINTTYNEIVAFEPTQIKSATGNIGAFDAANPDIRYKRTPLTGEPDSSETVRERLKGWTDATVKSLATAKASEAGFFGRVLRSPEWWKHPVLKRIYGVFRDRTDRAHELMHAAFDLPDGGSLFEAARDVLKDTKSRALLNEGVDYADVHEVPRERMEEWFRERGASDELVAFWGHLRDKYDALLEERLAPYREMVDKARAGYERQMVRRFVAAGVPRDAADLFDAARYEKSHVLPPDLAAYRHLVDREIRQARDKGITSAGRLADVRLVNEDGTVTVLSLAEAVNRMGQLKGFYAPRLREHGDYVVRGKRAREDGTEEFFRAHKQWRPAAERLRARMEKAGWDMAAVRKQEALPEATQQAVKALELAKTVESAANASTAADAMKTAFTAELVETLADEIKARGFRAASIRRAGRGGEVVKGYIEDAWERFGRYASNTAYGLAKMDAAGKAVRAVFGDGESPGIDIRKEPGTYRLAVEYLGEQLRNPENGDRMVALAKSVASFKFLGFNVKSALVNLTSMMTTVPAALRAYATGGKAGLARIGREVVRSTADYVGHMVGRPGRFSADEQAFMDVIKKESLDDPQFVREASRTFRDTTGRAWSFAMGKAMWMFAKTEQLNRGATLLAGYRLAREAGADHAAAMEAARETSDKAHGVYDKASQPSWTWGTGAGARVGQSFYVYKKYAHNYMQLVHDLFSRGDRKAAVFAVLSPMVLAGGAASVGWPVAKMMAAAVLLALGDDDKDPEKWMYDALRGGLGEGAERFGRFGLFGLAGLDLSGSMGGMIEMPKNAWELFGPAGGVAQDVLVDAPARLAAGQAGRAAEALLPTAVSRPLRALREMDGVTTSKGYPVWDEAGRPLLPTAGETAAKAVGLRPAREATLAARTWEAAREEAALGERRTQLYERYRAWLAKGGGDREELTEIVDAVADFNGAVQGAGLSGRVSYITRQSLAGQNRRMSTPTARERARLSGEAGERPEPVDAGDIEDLRHPYYDVARAYTRAKKAYDELREAGDRPGAARLRTQLRLALVGDLVGDVTGVRAEMTRVKRSGLPEAAKARRLEVLQRRERAAMEHAAARGGDLPGRLEALGL